jgi:predicted transcriptional regulator
MQRELELPRSSFRLARIERNDVCTRSDNLLLFRDQIITNDANYPGIGRWLDHKVLNGIKSGERTGFIGLLNERPVAAAIIKKGHAAKFCHLRIEPEARSKHLGDLFFVLMTLELRHCAKSVRFTLPESLWEGKGDFFKSFSFSAAIRCRRQYRLFDTELFCQAPFSSAFDSARAKLSSIFGHFNIRDHSLLTGAVMALHPEPLSKIFSGEKTVEIRTRFSARWEGQRISLYATRPNSSLAGEARVGRVIKGSKDRIWELFGRSAGCDRTEYEAYVGDNDEVFAITLDEVKKYRDEIPISQLSHLLGVDLPAPQSYLSLSNNDHWLSAVALSAALEGSISITDRPPSFGPIGSLLSEEHGVLPQ